MSEPAEVPSKSDHDGGSPDSEHGAQQAARHEGGDGQRTDEKNTVFDGDEHSDAPGPFGTG